MTCPTGASLATSQPSEGEMTTLASPLNRSQLTLWTTLRNCETCSATRETL